MSRTAEYWIEKLGLVPHPEGGHYRETYRSTGVIQKAALPGGHAGDRAYSTAIYYLLGSGEVSRLHRLHSDELFHFYAGSTLSVHVVAPQGEYERIDLGHDPERGEVLQAVVPARSWFGATVETDGGFALVGCTVAPGFDFDDFEQAERSGLLERFPRQRSIIERLLP